MSCPTLVKSAVISALAGFCLVSSAQDHELTTDVVVIGGGISGLSSAMSVLDHGGKVVVLENFPASAVLEITSKVLSQQIRITNAETDLKNRQQTRSTKTSFGSTTTESMPSF